MKSYGKLNGMITVALSNEQSAVESVCAEALVEGVLSSDVVINSADSLSLLIQQPLKRDPYCKDLSVMRVRHGDMINVI